MSLTRGQRKFRDNWAIYMAGRYAARRDGCMERARIERNPEIRLGLVQGAREYHHSYLEKVRGFPDQPASQL